MLALHTDARRAKVEMTDEMTPECGRDLVRLLWRLRKEGLYSDVELRITSPGGSLGAVYDYIREADSIRRCGLTVATHVPSTASSAAALLASLGDVRTAAPRAWLLYHIVRTGPIEGITAHGASNLHTTLADIDASTIDALAERARQPNHQPARRKAAIRDFAPSDWPVVARLLDENPSRQRGAQLERLRKKVAAAVAGDGSRLGALYRALFALDTPISSTLAAELRLIDRVDDATAPARSVDDGEPCIAVPEWAGLYPPDGRVPRAYLCRHILILGETGSGKTVSGILPAVAAILRDKRPGCMLVVDPKDEVAAAVERMVPAGGVVREIDLAKDTFNVMSGRNSIDGDLAGSRFLNAAKQILIRAASFDPDSIAKVLSGKCATSRQDPYWHHEGSRLAVAIVAFVLLVRRRAVDIFGTTGTPGCLAGMKDGEAGTALVDWGLRAGLVSRRADDPDQPEHGLVLMRSVNAPEEYQAAEHPADGSNILALAGDALEAVFALTADQPDAHGEYRWAETPFLAVAIADHLKGQPEFRSGEIPKLLRDIATYWKGIAISERQYVGVLGMARMVFNAFADEVPARVLRFGTEPGDGDPTVDFRAAVDADDRCTVFVLRPGLHRENALVARALKALYFETVLDNPRRQHDGARMPLAAYVADEFHRFVTDDEAHGEQSYIDTCRSQGGCCVLATQSVASLRYALGKAETATNDVVDILLANTATKLVFRSTEKGIRELVETLAPGGPGCLPVAAIRPPSTLRPGECYAALPDGRFERQQLKPYPAPSRAKGPSAAQRREAQGRTGETPGAM